MSVKDVFTSILSLSHSYKNKGWVKGFSCQPPCPRKHYWTHKLGYTAVRKDTFTMDLITEVGTAFHTVFQRYLPMVDGVEVFGNWKCRGKFCKYKDPAKPYWRSDSVCPMCKALMEYTEFRLTDDTGRSGKCDGLMRYKKKIYLVEYKSINTPAFGKLDDPTTQHKNQDANYHVCLTKTFGFEIEGTAIVYFPPVVHLFPEQYQLKIYLEEYDELRYKAQVKVAKAGFESIETGVLPWGICARAEDAEGIYCEFASNCFKKGCKTDPPNKGKTKVTQILTGVSSITMKDLF